MHTASLKRGYIGMGLLCNLFLGLGVFCQAATPNYTVDANKHVISVNNKGDAAANINDALQYLVKRPDQDTPWTLQFASGKYNIDKMLSSEHLQNVALISNPKKPAILAKNPASSIEYIFYTKFSQNITFNGFNVIGKTPTYIPSNYLTGSSAGWKDQGIYFGSCNNIVISNNRFLNIGDAAIRVTTTERDAAMGVNSFNTQILNNYFDNIYQITTTSNDTIHGGSTNMLVQNNTFNRIWGSVKFASRTPGAKYITYSNNIIRSSATDGMEIVGYDSMDISNNIFQNIARNAVNCYSNARATQGYQWGDDIIFRHNTINNAGSGIRFSADPYIADGFQPHPRNVVFTGNKITNLRGSAPAISLLKSDFPDVTVTNNLFSNIPSKKYLYMPMSNRSSVNFTGNMVDNKSLTGY